MEQKDKQLLLKDLCARVPYHPKGLVVNACTGAECDEWLTCATFTMFTSITNNCRLYLRPMSSMTEEEQKELSSRYVWKIDINGQIQIRYHSEGSWDDDTDCPTEEYLKLFDWLYKHHLDFRGLIPMGLAIEAPKDMYII